MTDVDWEVLTRAAEAGAFVGWSLEPEGYRAGFLSLWVRERASRLLGRDLVEGDVNGVWGIDPRRTKFWEAVRVAEEWST
jgi:hypothetical protein